MKLFWIGFAVVSFWSASASAQEPIAMSFKGMLVAMSYEVQSALKEMPDSGNQKIVLGDFSGEGPAASSSNFGLEIKRLFAELLKDNLADDSQLTLSGSYHFGDAELQDNRGLKVLRIVVQIKRSGKEIFSTNREVNMTDEIFQVLGLTGAAPHGTRRQLEDIRTNNQAVQQAAQTPRFEIQNETCVAAKALPQWSLGVLVRSDPDDSVQPVTPKDQDGHAFVEVRSQDSYELELVNDDSFATLVTLTIDGLDAGNTFAENQDTGSRKKIYSGYLIPAKSRARIRGWFRYASPSDEVVSPFRTYEHGIGSPSPLKACGPVGVITAQFREAVPQSDTLSGRCESPVKVQNAIAPSGELKSMIIGSNVLSTVSIRYNRPE